MRESGGGNYDTNTHTMYKFIYIYNYIEVMYITGNYLTAAQVAHQALEEKVRNSHSLQNSSCMMLCGMKYLWPV